MERISFLRILVTPNCPTFEPSDASTAFGVTWTSSVLPLRSIVTAKALSALERTIFVISSQEWISTPSMDRTLSPSLRPATKAAESFVTWPIIASLDGTPPCMNPTMMNTKMDKIKLFIGPAAFVLILFHNVAELNWRSTGATTTSVPSDSIIVAVFETDNVTFSSELMKYPVNVMSLCKSASSIWKGTEFSIMILSSKFNFWTTFSLSRTIVIIIPGLISCSSSSCPAIRTYPPIGNKRSVYTVSPLRTWKIFGPIPIANSRTNIPAFLAK